MGPLVSPRTDLAAILATNAPSGVQVYDHPADVVKVPALIVQNGDPMIELDTMGGDRFQWNLEIVAATYRINSRSGVAWCEDISRDVASWLNGSGFWFREVSQPGTDEINQIDAITVTMTIEAKMRT